MRRDGAGSTQFSEKYLDLALSELLARLSDNFHLREQFGDERVIYEGPWQMRGRPIDPCLEITRPLPTAADDELGMDPPNQLPWWLPDGPDMDQQGIDTTWIAETKGHPSPEALARRHDGETTWVALRGSATWDSPVPHDEDRYECRRRHAWLHVFSWFTRAGTAASLVRSVKGQLEESFLASNADLNNSAYLAEAPWATAAKEYPATWQPFSRSIDIEVLSTNIEYSWSSGEGDSTLAEPENVIVPVDAFFEDRALRWLPETRSWESDGVVQVRYEEWSNADQRHRGLLVREDWLQEILERNGLELVVGIHGERGMIGGDVMGAPEGWGETTTISSLRDGNWRHGKVRHQFRTPA